MAERSSVRGPIVTLAARTPTRRLTESSLDTLRAA